MNPRLFLALNLMTLAGCVSTLSNERADQSELACQPYPDINSVPFGAEAHSSRHWHEKREENARFQDKSYLEAERLRMLQEGEKLRQEANLSSTQRNP